MNQKQFRLIAFLLCLLIVLGGAEIFYLARRIQDVAATASRAAENSSEANENAQKAAENAQEAAENAQEAAENAKNAYDRADAVATRLGE